MLSARAEQWTCPAGPADMPIPGAGRFLGAGRWTCSTIRAAQRDMPIPCGGRWTRGHHALCPRRAMDMPNRSGGHAQSWRRTISWRWAMYMLNGPGCPEGHAHSLWRPVDTWASCSLPAPSNGHAQQVRRTDQGTCPPPDAEGEHVHEALRAGATRRRGVRSPRPRRRRRPGRGRRHSGAGTAAAAPAAASRTPAMRKMMPPSLAAA